MLENTKKNKVVYLFKLDFIVFQVAEEIWVCEKGTVTKWQGDILSYKDHLKSKILKEASKNK